MAGILKRTVLFEKKGNGVYRFSDWAIATTEIGACYEPFCCWGLRSGINGDVSNFDWTDEMSRIDHMQNIDLDKEKRFLSDGTSPSFMGGTLMPRNGR